ncbi:MAG: SGNH/GDSL hydrolase family protein, partial [Akkermansiaceae bacterium]
MKRLAVPFLILSALISPLAGQGNSKPKDAKGIKLNRKAPPKDPELARYYINRKSSPRAEKAAPVETTLPLQLKKGDRICFIGNLLLDAERRYGHLETLMHQLYPEHELSFRNLAWPADEIDLMPRPDNFGDLDQHLTFFKADVIIAAFGYNESFAGEDGLPDFEKRLDAFLMDLKSKAYNGKSAPKVVLLSPTRCFNTLEVKAGDLNNLRISAYFQVMKKAADKHKVGFVDLFGPVVPMSEQAGSNLASDGHQRTLAGHEKLAVKAAETLSGRSVEYQDGKGFSINEDLRRLVVDKAEQFFYRYRPLNTFYYTGGRNRSYGYLDF